jgi:hypothetical protein
MSYTQTLKQLSADTMEELGLHDNQARLITGFGVNFLRKANNEVKGEIKTTRELTPSNRRIKLPDDFIDYSKIGVQYKEGVKLLAQNEYLAKLDGKDLPSAYPVAPSPQFIQNAYGAFYGYPGWDGGTGRIMAYGNGNDLGKWSINYREKTLTLSSDFDLNTNIYIEYLSDCTQPSYKTFVCPYLQLACQYWQKWHYYLSKENLSMAREFKGLYEEEWITAKFLYSSLDIPSIINNWEFHYGGIE